MIETYFINADVYNDDSVFYARFSKLSSFRKDKILQYRFRKDKNLSLGAGMLLDFCLKKIGLREKNMEYVLGDNGKPHFKCIGENKEKLKNIYFNISHSGNIVICSWGNISVGVDIEKVETRKKNTIPYNMLSSDESNYLLSLPGEMDKLDAFYRIWTLKESFVKMMGLGLSFDFRDFTVVLGKKKIIIQGANDVEYYFEEYLIPGYKASVCCRKKYFCEPIEVFENLIEQSSDLNERLKITEL